MSTVYVGKQDECPKTFSKIRLILCDALRQKKIIAFIAKKDKIVIIYKNVFRELSSLSKFTKELSVLNLSASD